jgi:hypothetical protein
LGKLRYEVMLNKMGVKYQVETHYFKQFATFGYDFLKRKDIPTPCKPAELARKFFFRKFWTGLLLCVQQLWFIYRNRLNWMVE